MPSFLSRLLCRRTYGNEVQKPDALRVSTSETVATTSFEIPAVSAAAPAHDGPRLEMLPAEVLVIIAYNVAPVDRACLALSCRTTLWKVGHAALRLGKQSQFELLHRLERNGASKGHILCPGCKVFHPPSLSRVVSAWSFENGIGTRPCWEDYYNAAGAMTIGSQRTMKYLSTNLPYHVHFNIVSAIMRSHRHGWDVHTTNVLKASHRRQGTSGYPKLYQRFSCKIIAGRLVLKSEKLILPCKGYHNIKDRTNITKYAEFLNSWPLNRCCNHRYWRTGYCSIFSPCLRILRTICIRCQAWDSSASNTLEISQRTQYMSRIYGCAYCYTDYALALLDLPDEAGQVIVMTTWKDLGYGQSLDDPRWRSHHVQRLTSRTDRLRLQNDRGSIGQAYEADVAQGNDDGGGGVDQDASEAVWRIDPVKFDDFCR
ncbi:hypothetical protein HIM_04652 [Hirsutella minnesotensis 3608]|uniref:Uncharacterized protein n=1 Tax=Hirsutella minnesotensis 3608 TaxID=1043627 RepID=A0A0F7ZV16_9HYPO|nr:hypothetical protein HIM_04652 [Hirsutella minnesotensis 3608]